MRSLLVLSLLLVAAGCGESASVSGTSETVAKPEAITVSFDQGDTATLEVPEMSCPFMCYPKVKETLEGMDGVTAVELVPQEREDAINDRRVTVTFDGHVDGAEAVAALSKAGFANSNFE